MSKPLTDDEPTPITFERFLDLLGAEHLDERENQLLAIRETFTCPFQVAYDEITGIFGDYHIHLNIRRYHLRPDHYQPRPEDGPLDGWKDRFWQGGDLERQWRHALGAESLRVARWNAYKGREGGMPAAIDTFTTWVIRSTLEGYISYVMSLHLGDTNDVATYHERQEQLAKRLINRFGTLLFPGEDITRATLFVLNNELSAIVKTLAFTLRSLSRHLTDHTQQPTKENHKR